MNIKFANGKTFEYLNALETEEYFNGSNRRTLTVECMPTEISVDELNTILSDELNTMEIILTNAEIEATSVHSGYILKLKCGVENKLMSEETPDTPAKYEDRLVFKLGKRTYIEEQLKKLGI